MTQQATTESPRPSARQARTDELRTQIAAVAVAATDTDRRIVQEILQRAATGEYGSKTYDLTPGIGALLFIEHNPHNRDWDPAWTLELSRRQTAGFWRKNNEPPGFYKDGALADAQHRLAAVAHSGVTWTTVVVFGMDREAIITIDAGRRRDAASALKMDGMQEARLKQTIAKNAAAYLVKQGDRDAALRSEMEIAKSIHTHHDVLETAIGIAQTSMTNLVNPVLKLPIAATTAYLMLSASPVWQTQRVREKLALFQTGQAEGGESEPFFTAGKLIEQAHEKPTVATRLSTSKEIGVVLHAMRLSEQGVRAVRKNAFLSAVKQSLPTPGYPDVAQQAAAE
jgi:hypothetical protein